MAKSFKQGKQHVGQHPVAMSYCQHLTMPLFQEVRQLISKSPPHQPPRLPSGFGRAPFLSTVQYEEENEKYSFSSNWFMGVSI